MRALDRPSPNHGDRRGGARPDLVVLHYTAMASAEAAVRWLCDPASNVSAHWLIDEAGRTTSMVDEAARAWHAGAGAWGVCGDVNSSSIGIELANDGASPFPDAQMRALEILLCGIGARWSIQPHRVIAHSDCAPGRKIDPGPRFDWTRLARSGLAAGPVGAAGDASVADGPAFVEAVRGAGYTAPAGTEALLAAFRLRHRPGASGPLSGADVAHARAVAAAHPVDRRPGVI